MTSRDPSLPDDTGDLADEELRRALDRATAIAADYLRDVGERDVLPQIEPGDVSRQLGVSPPAYPVSMEIILDDYQRIIEPNLSHWNHPSFFSYFAITGSGPGLVAETLAASTNVNAMLWRTSPAAVELEARVCDWLRQMIDLPSEFVGHINDTASSSTLVALAAARHRAFPGVRQLGWVGLARELQGLPVIYASEHVHSSIDKSALTLGLGTEQVRKIECDAEFRMDAGALARAIAVDRAAGNHPFAVVATAGTTSTTSIDPINAVADICERELLWLHVDAAYAGSAAICPEIRQLMGGLERADSIVLNPHKWLFVQVDCSVLLTRGYDGLREAFSLVAEYLETDEDVVNPMDLGPQLGRRFRALKLWMVIRAFGLDGLKRRIRAHCAYARLVAERLDSHDKFEIVAPVPLSTVCFVHTGGDAANVELIRRVNATGKAFLSHTSLGGQTVVRVAIGNLRTTPHHIDALINTVISIGAEL